MDPIIGPIIALIAVIVSTGAGIGAGVGIAGGQHAKHTAKALEAHSASIVALQEGQAALLETATRPIVIDAEIRDQLADVPVQCRTAAGGDPMSPECQWATCLQYGQSSAQRPECEDVRDLMVESLRGRACPELP